MRRLSMGAAAVITMLSAPLHAQDKRDDAVTFQLATDVVPTDGVQLANGVIVYATDWPTLIVTKIKQQGHVVTCTGTLVGPNVVMLAAHCVDTILATPAKQAWLTVDNRDLPLVCEMHPLYAKQKYRGRVPRGSEDYGFCLIRYGERMSDTVAALRFEVVDVKSALAPKDAVLMTGYGCDEIKVVDGELKWTEADRTLRIGDEQIDNAAGTIAGAPAYVTIRSTNGAEPVLCPGDSGGPLFTGASVGKPNVARRVRGINSKVHADARGAAAYDIISSVSATSTTLFETWAREWLKKHKASEPIICGVNRTAGQPPCRP